MTLKAKQLQFIEIIKMYINLSYCIIFVLFVISLTVYVDLVFGNELYAYVFTGLEIPYAIDYLNLLGIIKINNVFVLYKFVLFRTLYFVFV